MQLGDTPAPQVLEDDEIESCLDTGTRVVEVAKLLTKLAAKLFMERGETPELKTSSLFCTDVVGPRRHTIVTLCLLSC